MSLHRETLVGLVQQRGWTSGAELGVDKGILFRMLLEQVPSLHLTGVDIFPDRQRSRRAFLAVDEYPGRAELLTMPTAKAADRVSDEALDFVFIDADHSYTAVRQDIAQWRPKVKPGGWLGGHDYHPSKFPGVVKAVQEVYPDAQLYPGTIWGVQC